MAKKERVPRQKMVEQEPAKRVLNFEEVPYGYDEETAKIEAARCLQCAKPLCVDECPVNIDPLSIIVDLRRYLVMEESKVPTELTGMLTNIENNGAPWQFSPADRLNWANEE